MDRMILLAKAGGLRAPWSRGVCVRLREAPRGFSSPASNKRIAPSSIFARVGASAPPQSRGHARKFLRRNRLVSWTFQGPRATVIQSRNRKHGQRLKSRQGPTTAMAGESQGTPRRRWPPSFVTNPRSRPRVLPRLERTFHQPHNWGASQRRRCSPQHSPLPPIRQESCDERQAHLAPARTRPA